MTRFFMTSALTWLLVGGSAFAQDAAQTGATTRNSIKLARVMMDLPAGSPYLSVKTGTTFCAGGAKTQTWVGGAVALNVSPYSVPFKAELTSAGYKVITPGEDNLFDPEAGSADFQAAAVISGEHVEGCVSRGEMWTSTNAGDVEGTGSMSVDWQIYSPIEKKVVAHIHTSGASKLDHAVPGGLQQLILAAFDDNVRQLASSTDFHVAMGASNPLTAGLQTPGQQTKIVLSGSSKAGPRKIADAVGSVVTIMNGIGSGSGALVSDDGYILTNAHVVGDGKQARVRWSDGIETLGQVVRVSKNRDVALIKTDPRDRTPLALKRGPVTPGQRVYAIGSPRGKDFQGTVSSGVISADRVFDGLRYIQSDTVVSPGSSGGPLLDENGSVIGLTDLGVQNDGPAGLNLFIPIGDVMDFLSLAQQSGNPDGSMQAGR